jgi:ribosomal protein S18 acetylase RimI-like enzyme
VTTEPSRAEEKDALEVMDLITRCKLGMRGKGIFQWDDIYPNIEVVLADARGGTLFVIREGGRCVASVSVNDSQPAEYAALPWKCRDGRAFVIHRLCVDPEFEGRGLGRRLMGFSEERARLEGGTSLRLDAYTGNPRAIQLYERGGYERIGQTFFPRRPLPFDCFEKAFT